MNKTTTDTSTRHRWVLSLAIVWCIAASSSLFAPQATAFQRQKQKDVLTDKQTEDLRAADDDPVEKLKLYVGYIDERTQELHQVNTNPREQNRDAEIHNLYQEFTQLSDELEDNMDSFDQQHEDLRKGLKLIVEKSGKWPDALNEPKPSEGYDFARKTALESSHSLHDDAQKLLEEQEQFFAKQKKEKGKTGG